MFVPDGTSDPTCTAPNVADTFASHAGACNGPILGPIPGAAAYAPGDAFQTLYVALDIRNGHDDPCALPVTPGTNPTRINLTTGTAQRGIMDSAAVKSNVLAGVRDGVPFDCPAFLNGTPSGRDADVAEQGTSTPGDLAGRSCSGTEHILPVGRRQIWTRGASWA